MSEEDQVVIEDDIVPAWKEALEFMEATGDSLFSERKGKSINWHFTKAGTNVPTSAVDFLLEHDQVRPFGALLLDDLANCLELNPDRPPPPVVVDSVYGCGDKCPLGCSSDDPPPCGAPCVVKCKNHDGENSGAWCIRCCPSGLIEAARAGTIEWIGEKP